MPTKPCLQRWGSTHTHTLRLVIVCAVEVSGETPCASARKGWGLSFDPVLKHTWEGNMFLHLMLVCKRQGKLYLCPMLVCMGEGTPSHLPMLICTRAGSLSLLFVEMCARLGNVSLRLLVVCTMARTLFLRPMPKLKRARNVSLLHVLVCTGARPSPSAQCSRAQRKGPRGFGMCWCAQARRPEPSALY